MDRCKACEGFLIRGEDVVIENETDYCDCEPVKKEGVKCEHPSKCPVCERCLRFENSR